MQYTASLMLPIAFSPIPAGAHCTPSQEAMSMNAVPEFEKETFPPANNLPPKDRSADTRPRTPSPTTCQAPPLH